VDDQAVCPHEHLARERVVGSTALPERRELGGIAVQRNGVRNGASEREPAERLRP